MHIEWTKPEYLGIKWPESQTMPEPRREIDQKELNDLMFGGQYSLQGINFNQLFIEDKDGTRHLEGVHFFWFPSYAVAVADRYAREGHVYRFWRIGCEHPNAQWNSPRMFEHNVKCPDCGWGASYDSSG